MNMGSNTDEISSISRNLCGELGMLVQNISTLIDRSEVGEDKCNDSSIEQEFLHYMKIPLCAPFCYQKAYELDPSNAIKLLGNYLRFSRILEKDERLQPLKNFFRGNDAIVLFKLNIKTFLRDVLPLAFQFNTFNGRLELEEMGMHVEVIPKTCYGDFYIHILLVFGKDIENFEYEYLKEYIDDEMEWQIEAAYEKSRNKPEDELVMFYNPPTICVSNPSSKAAIEVN